MRAQSGGVQYATGWNLVGGPAGTDLSAAVALFSYAAGGYSAPAAKSAQTCTGYWAYFSHPVQVALNGQPPVSATQTCPLPAGWSIVGNPFDAVAMLPTGTIAYRWDPAAGVYGSTGSIPVGGAVWVYEATASSITLRSMGQVLPSVTPVPAASLVITLPPQPEYRVHVGDTVEFVQSGALAYLAKADPAYLQLLDSGTTLSYPAGHFWRWRAIAAGMTSIVIDPACRQATPPCGVPTLLISIDILP